MNPRVSRSSALASKATGFPIAKIAAKLAVGYTLDEIPNDITRKTPACFEPTLDYVVVKMPRWAFEKFPLADRELTTHMKSVGEAMAIGRTFKEAFLKALRSRELDARRSCRPTRRRHSPRRWPCPPASATSWCCTRFRNGLEHGRRAPRSPASPPFFLTELRDIVELEHEVARGAATWTPRLLRRLKRYGFCDERLAALTGRTEREVRALRLRARRHARLQSRRHLRRRVRGRDAVLLLHLRGRERGAARRARARRHPGQRPQPHRPGHRVRLLLRACRHDGARASATTR